MHYYDHHISDFLAATDFLNNEERFIYLRLIWHYYDREKPLPNEPDLLARRFQTTPEIVKAILGHFFELSTGGVWCHKRIDAELKKYHLRIEAAKRGGKASGKARRKAASEPTLNDTSTTLELTNNQQPITNNHIKKKQAKKKAAPRFKKPTAAQVADYMNEIGARGFTADQWFAHYESNGWMVGKTKMKDWRAAVRTWNARREAEQPAKTGDRKIPAYDQYGNVIPGKYQRI